MLKHTGYSLKANRKTIDETQHPNRNQQFEFIADMKKWLAGLDQPVISVDSKKNELIGKYEKRIKISDA